MTNEEAKRLFIETLESEDTVFTSYDDSPEQCVRVSTTSFDNLDEITISIVFFASDEDDAVVVTTACYDLPNFSDDLKTGYKLCNHFNDEDTSKFYIDDEGDVIVEQRLSFNFYGISTGFSPELVLSAATQVAAEADEAYAYFIEAL
jgi:hypothetical protein